MSLDSQPNPYAPTPVVQHKGPVDEIIAIREKHLSHEASIKSMAVLFLLGGILSLLVGIFYVAAGSTALLDNNVARDTELTIFFLVFGCLLTPFAVFQLAVAIGLRKLASWTKVPAAILATIGLIAVPIGTVINGYFLYLLLCEKGRTVFTPEYKRVIEATPHIRYKTSIVVWIFVGLLIALISIGIVGALIGG
jgi:tellurite resistance protein TehA-like permease